MNVDGRLKVENRGRGHSAAGTGAVFSLLCSRAFSRSGSSAGPPGESSAERLRLLRVSGISTPLTFHFASRPQPPGCVMPVTVKPRPEAQNCSCKNGFRKGEQHENCEEGRLLGCRFVSGVLHGIFAGRGPVRSGTGRPIRTGAKGGPADSFPRRTGPVSFLLLHLPRRGWRGKRSSRSGVE